MDYEYIDIPDIVGRREELPRGANLATEITVYRCPCGNGTVEHSRVPGFDDEWFTICCPECSEKYSEAIVRQGNRWKVYKR